MGKPGSLSDEELQKRVESICEPVPVTVLPSPFYHEILLYFIQDRSRGRDLRPEPVCLVTDRTPFRENSGAAHPFFELYTFYNWLRSGFRIVLGAQSSRFQVFKGFGLSMGPSHEAVQPIIQDLLGYRLLPNGSCADSPYGILHVGAEKRTSGAAPISFLLHDARGYGWLQGDSSIRIPLLEGLFILSAESSERFGIPSGTCGQNIRRFGNPFRVFDLELMMSLSQADPSHRLCSFWSSKAEAIAALSSELAGFSGDLTAYVAYLAMAMGRIAASLIERRILHESLSDHCQNVTLGGELTEFDWSVTVPRIGAGRFEISGYESRLYSQVLLLANHVRHFAVSMDWIGVRYEHSDYAKSFALGMKESLSEELVEGLLFHFDRNPYCADITLAVHSPFSEKNLRGCEHFISLLHEAVREVFHHDNR